MKMIKMHDADLVRLFLKLQTYPLIFFIEIFIFHIESKSELFNAYLWYLRYQISDH